jgi:hypothetical protein
MCRGSSKSIAGSCSPPKWAVPTSHPLLIVNTTHEKRPGTISRPCPSPQMCPCLRAIRFQPGISLWHYGADLLLAIRTDSIPRPDWSVKLLVEMRGVEPLTSSLQRRRSPTELHPRELHPSEGPLPVGLPGLEPGTTPLSEEYSNQLSYRPVQQKRLRLSS